MASKQLLSFNCFGIGMSSSSSLLSFNYFSIGMSSILPSFIIFKLCYYSVSVQFNFPLDSMAEHTNTELISQFTGDAYATEDRYCECLSCGIYIKVGEPCLYVATINPGQVGRHVCAACYSRYKNKRATSRRPKPTSELGWCT